MESKTIDQMRESDLLTRRFGSQGFHTAALLTEESSAAFLKSLVDVELVSCVPDSVRSTYDRIRILHCHGLLEYQLFTAASQLASLAIEQALGERFVEFYKGTIPLTKKEGSDASIEVSSFSDLRDRVPSKNKFRLAGLGTDTFTASPKQLFTWARFHGLLDGQRTRHRESVSIKLRNFAAHPEHHVVTPIDSGRSIRSLGELINRLWGQPMGSTSSYPGPIDRELLLFTLATDLSTSFGPPSAFDLPEMPADTRCFLILAVRHDRDLHYLDVATESAQFPVTVLAGPCSPAEVSKWLANEEPKPDRVSWIDRTFYVRVNGPVIDPPRSHQQAVDLSDNSGTWHLIKADFPADAQIHARNTSAAEDEDGEKCDPSGPCSVCCAETMKIGSFNEVVNG
jgi:hypothetical protein